MLRGFGMRNYAVAGLWGILAAGPVLAGTESRSDIDRAIDVYLAEGQTDSAAALAERALDLATAQFGGDARAVAVYADSLGNRFFQAYDFAHGVALFERGVTLRESVLAPDDLALADPIENLSTAYYIAGRYDEAAIAQERVVAIKAAKLGPDDASTARSRLDLAIVYFPSARYADAERELRAAIRSLEPARGEDPLPLAQAEQVLGEVCRELNRYREAEEYLTDALALVRRGLPERDPGTFTYLNSLAGYYKDQARYDESELLLEEALDIVEAHPSLEDERAALTLNMAEVHRLQGRYDDAIPLYQSAIALATKSMPSLDVAIFRNQIASAYAEMGRPRDAEAQYRQALAVADSSTDASPLVIAQFKNDLGVLLAREGRLADGESLLGEAITLRESVYGPSHPLVAVSLTQLARAQARLFGGASSKRTPRDAEAALLLDRALSIFDSTTAEPEGRVDAGISRAELYHRDHKIDRAAETMAGALENVESLRPYRGGGGEERIEFMRRYVDAYDRMTAWQVELGKVGPALDYSERRRARVLVDQLTGASRGAPTEEARAALERLRVDRRDLESQLGKCQADAGALRAKPRLSKSERSQLASIEATCDRIVGEIQRAGERIRRLESTGNYSPAPTAAARPRVPTGEALLVYHVGGESSFVFIVEGEAVRAYPLKVSSEAFAKLGMPSGPLTRASLAQLLSGYDAAGKPAGLGILRQLATPVESSAQADVAARAHASALDRLHALFGVLMPAEVWSRIRTARQVTVIPDGPLASFPFEALVVTREKNDASFWLDDGPVVRYAPSIATLEALASAGRARTASRDVLSVCNPRYATANEGTVTKPVTRGGPLSPLPGTERETETVVAAFGKDRVTVLCGEAATEAAVRRAVAGKEIVHLATHGLVSERRSDLLTALAFTPASSPPRDLRDDGFLHLFEIYDLALSAELVVLSACESSTGSYVLGEGVMALSRGFLSAGARRVVATQWKVDDDATAALVGEFLSRVASAGRANQSVDYARALREAKRTVRARAEWSQPFYWAAFVVSGAP
ncbi:MAG TPA: CHAT domain-containing tetratricopeptide repeat protein [Candidatus Krumholzibacteria bacterium]|nr:CHAT domain-containing tetratricopeptide repeat protein [Candidatus Krumholzibacteria bacterium]